VVVLCRQKGAYEMRGRLEGSEMCMRDKG